MNDNRVDTVLRELTNGIVADDDVNRRIERRVMRQITRPRRSRRALYMSPSQPSARAPSRRVRSCCAARRLVTGRRRHAPPTCC